MKIRVVPRSIGAPLALGVIGVVALFLMACGAAATPTAPPTDPPAASPTRMATVAAPASNTPTPVGTVRVTEPTPTPAAQQPTATPRPTAVPQAAASAKDKAVLAIQAEPASLSTFSSQCSGNVPHSACEEIASDPLTWIDGETFEVVPLSGVDSWSQEAPNRWRFKLREGVTFHNGEPWNAEAAKLGIDWHGDKATSGHGRGAYGFHAAIQAEVVDNYTVDVVCEKDCPILPRTTMFTTFQAPKWWAGASDDERERMTIGFGPYKIAEHRTGVEVRLEAFADYKPNFAYDAQAPAIKDVRQVWRQESLVRASMVAAGEADWAVDIGFENVDRVPQAITGTNNEVFILVPDNIWHPELKKKEVRMALALAVDCETIMETLYNGLQECFGNISQRGTVGITPENSKPYPYDPARARELLQQAGYDTNNVIRIHGRAGRVYRDVELYEAIVTMWREIGVNAETQILEESKARDARSSGCGRYGAESRDCINRPPPAPWAASTHYYETATSNESLDYQRQLLLRNSCFNVNSRVCEPQPGGLQDQLEEAIQTPLGPERAAVMEKLAQYIHDQYYFLPFFEQVTVYGLAKDLEWKARYDPRIRPNTMRFK